MSHPALNLIVPDKLYDRLSKSHDALRRGIVICNNCGRTIKVNSKHCLERGWPECCGETMSLES